MGRHPGSPAILTGALDQLQYEMHVWRTHNFPEGMSTHQLLGVVEETGELSHAHLKSIQGIRTGVSASGTIALERDAIGDLLIFLAGYCSYSGISMAECLLEAWDEVKERDWVKWPKNGLDA